MSDNGMYPVIRVENLGKEYQLGAREERYTTFRDALLRTARAPIKRLRELSGWGPESSKFWALKDISFDVQAGEAIGVIGPNGAGKSTLLKVLSRITEPTTGMAEIRGRVGSLLEVGTGFHNELTGRENVFLNGAILGMGRGEIRRKFDEIVQFAGVEQFLDTPVKRYSSGMKVRLGFAVAAHLEPEILIVDEVLAVGDVQFQKKCLGKMEEVGKSGRTVLFVSHNMAAIESLCTSALLLDAGHVRLQGEVEDVIAAYLATVSDSTSDVNLAERRGRNGAAAPLLRRFRILDSAGDVLPHVPLGGDCVLEFELFAETAIHNAVITFTVSNARGQCVFVGNTKIQCHSNLVLENHSFARCILKNCRLLPGQYRLELRVRSRRKVFDEVNGLYFEVAPRDVYGTGRLPKTRAGLVAPEVEWQFDSGIDQRSPF